MSDFTTVNTVTNEVPEFVCGTELVTTEERSTDAKELSTQAVSIVATHVRAISDDHVEVFITVNGAPGARVESFRADNTWASIGQIVAGQLSNPNVPTYYLLNPEQIRLRLVGYPSATVTLQVTPILTRLSSHKNNDGSISVTGSTTMRSGIVQAFSNNAWKGIGVVTDGVFSNPAVPSTYLYNANTMRVRVYYSDGNIASGTLDSTLGFPHPRSVLIRPLQNAAAEQAVMSWRMQWADYQPTGYFAPAGTNVEVWVSGNAEDVTLLVGTQGMADRNNPYKQSDNMRRSPLT
ncbi:Peptidase M60, enhancin and enhancin-like [Pseudomonas syringae]|uniref:M60 family peptidase N-terminal accessory domain-containing protein n=1 Tax=Pseudomonas syringae TaxID=317 RepID=UPI0008957E70|nr:M60 family peptidase N-terminal accessory domain-containing protein [Pseudomonas syringae]SDX33260.1 Peptidase M60, enhancin and enhancin-like [Pseudomonas syringae]SFM46966.1 Peptidase M60, enhancin and enhancin-like [Pseudomonas syringae]